MFEAIEACDSCEPLQASGHSYCRDCGLRMPSDEPALGARPGARPRSLGWAWLRPAARS